MATKRGAGKFVPEQVVEVEEEEDEEARSKRLGAGCFGMEGGCFQSCNPVQYDHVNVIEYNEVEDRSCWFRIPQIYIRFNPIVTIAAISIIWGFVAFCMIQPQDAKAEMDRWLRFITEKFTWLYIISQDVWALLIIAIYFNKYGNTKLGKDDEEPEYNDASWFAMLFACGVGIGLFFFGVAEPIWHYDLSGGGNRYLSDPNIPDNTLAQIAINLTFYHWGIHAWIVYCMVGMLMGLVSYRMGLPMTVKSCFYPLLGDKIYGWIGDALDTISIVTTLFGVCTSLGFGTMQLNTGLSLMNENIEISTRNQIIIIWGITCIATLSTLSGLNVGIRRLSEICFSVGMIIMLVCLFLDNTWYILNVFVQSIGYYIQWIIQLGFHCDAFEQSLPSYGGQESRNRAAPDGSTDGYKTWMDDWTVFYWGWWISWSPFVGMFIAKVSRGRTIRQFITGTMTAPILYSFMWMSIFGAIGIKMERNAARIGLCCSSNFNKTYNLTIGLPEPMVGDWMCDDGMCNPCSTNIINIETDYGRNDSVVFYKRMMEDRNFGVVLDNLTVTRLTCHSKEEMWFDVMNSYGGLGSTLKVISLIGIILYFVTSSDSGSFVIDCLAANGDKDPPRIQRVFWALTEGATATALLYAGGEDGLAALRTVSVAVGAPYTVILCFMCISLWRCLAVDHKDLDQFGPQFAVGITDPIAIPTVKGLVGMCKNIIIAPYTFARAMIYTSEEPEKNPECQLWSYTIVMYILLIGFVVCQVCVIWVEEIWAIGWVLYIAFASLGGSTRIGMRAKYKINGNMVEDLSCGIFMYPFLAYQLSETMDYYDNRKSKGLDVVQRPMAKNESGDYYHEHPPPFQPHVYTVDTNGKASHKGGFNDPPAYPNEAYIGDSAEDIQKGMPNIQHGYNSVKL